MERVESTGRAEWVERGNRSNLYIKVELGIAKLKMQQFSLGATNINKIRNYFIKETAHEGRFRNKVRGETEVIYIGWILKLLI